jgi:urease accessory protein
MLDRVSPEAAAQDVPTIAASLHFARGGGRTFLLRQHVPYPFHITRPHASADSGQLATLILQSAAGGLYRGDRLGLDIGAGAGARAHVVSQAATVVHAARGRGVVVETRLDAAPGALLAVTTDPHILFPDARLSIRTDVTFEPSATVIVAEGFATHDPTGAHRAFGHLAMRCRVARRDDVCLVDDVGVIDGLAFASDDSPLGPYRAMGSVMILGNAATGLDVERLDVALTALGVLAGATTLPNGAGLGLRLLAEGGGPLARGLHTIVRAAFEAATGHPMPPRRI